MKSRIKKRLIAIWDEIEYGLRRLCGKPSPMKQFIIILILGGSLSVSYIYSLVSSIYNIGKRDVELMHIEHIKQLELQHKNDSINILKQQMYEQSTE